MNLLRQAEWMRQLVVIADDERARQHHPDVDCDHLFLGLLALGGPVTTALREAGVTLEAARAELATLHSERIAALGIRVEPLDTRGPIPSPSTRGLVDFNERALRVLKTVPSGSPARASVALWEALRAEPSTDLDHLLVRLGAEPGAVSRAVAAHAEMATYPAEDAVRERTGTWATYRTFIPAVPDDVWALVSDFGRWMEWNAPEHESARILQDGSLEVRHPRKGRRGRPPVADSPRFVSHYTLVRTVPGELIEWARTSPGTDFRWLLQISLTPQTAGTRLELGYRYDFPGGRPRGVYRAFGARMIAFIGTFYLRSKADDISRALR